MERSVAQSGLPSSLLMSIEQGSFSTRLIGRGEGHRNGNGMHSVLG